MRAINLIGLRVGQQVHLKHKRGVFTIQSVSLTSFMCNTRAMRFNNEIMYCRNDQYHKDYNRNVHGLVNNSPDYKLGYKQAVADLNRKLRR